MYPDTQTSTPVTFLCGLAAFIEPSDSADLLVSIVSLKVKMFLEIVNKTSLS